MKAEDYREIPMPRAAEGCRKESLNDFSFLR